MILTRFKYLQNYKKIVLKFYFLPIVLARMDIILSFAREITPTKNIFFESKGLFKV